MNKKWLTLLLVLVLILSISACNKQKEASTEVDAPAPQTEQDQDQGEHTDADMDGEDQHKVDTGDAQSDEEDADTGDADADSEESEPAPELIDVAGIYAKNCSGCHGVNREGGPANKPLLPEFLSEDAVYYADFISEGSPSDSRMKPWKDNLSAEEITALAEWILISPQ